MNYQQTIEFMFDRLPMYQRIGVAAYKANLDNTIALCNLLENPQNNFKTIHIAGTNGKGSTSHMLASILQSAGYKTGLYTSPHLKDFRERIKINGEKIPENEVVDFVEQFIFPETKNKLELSFFEMTVGLAFYYFEKQNVDIAIIETGLGGRLDSTNVITPEISIITNISYDHTALLGNTLEKIATEKAGIIKPGVPVIIGESQEETNQVFISTANQNDSKIIFADKIYQPKNIFYNEVNTLELVMDIENRGPCVYKQLSCELLGLYQQKNIVAVLCAVDLLNKKNYFIPENAVRNGCRNVITKTKLLGRWQILKQHPLVVADIAHNEAGIKEIIFQISKTKFQNLHIVLGMVADKDISAVLNLLPKDATYYFCKANIPRALKADDLKDAAKVFGLSGKVYPSVKAAVDKALECAEINDLVFIGGSTFVVAEVDL